MTSACPTASPRRRPNLALPPLAAFLTLAACSAAPDGEGWRLGWTHPAAAASPVAAPTSGETIAGSFLVGRFALDQGDFKEAAESYEHALEADPGNVELQRQLLALWIADGDFDKAVAAAESLSAADPEADDAILLLALDATRKGDLDEAERRLEQLGGVGLTGTVKPVLLAWAQFGAGDPAQAMATLQAPDARGGLDRLHAFHRATMLGLIGKPQVGVELLRSTFGDPSQAPFRVVRAVASLEVQAGKPEQAKELIGQARAQDPDDRHLEALAQALQAGEEIGAIHNAGDGMSDALIEVAQALSEQEGSAQALLFARLASFVRPEEADAWMVITAVLLRQNNAEEALKALDEVPAESPFAWEAGFARARALQALDRTEEAVSLLRKMSEEAPARSDAPLTLGDLLRGEERYAEAEQAYTQAIERLPRLEPRHWRLLYARGITYERTKRWPQAEADLLKALELEPDQPLVLNYLGYSWVDQHLNLERAKAMLHRAVELRPEDGFIVDSLGWAYYRLGDYGRAVEYLERAVELEPGDPVINDHLGDALWRVGRMREARFQWSRSLTLEPEADLVASIQGKLANGLPAVAERKG